MHIKYDIITYNISIYKDNDLYFFFYLYVYALKWDKTNGNWHLNLLSLINGGSEINGEAGGSINFDF